MIVDPSKYAIFPVKASGEDVQRETVKSLAKQHGAIAAINGGFWKENGTPAGILKINNTWHGTSNKTRGAIGWSSSGEKVLIDRISTKNYLDNLDYIVGGAPLLVKRGRAVEDHSIEQVLKSFLTRNLPRTAIGIRANGEWVFVVVDGTSYGLFGGISIKKLASLMLDLGCTEALNLDGGGSSTMVVDDTVINTPCGKVRESGKLVEAVSDAILISPI